MIKVCRPVCLRAAELYNSLYSLYLIHNLSLPGNSEPIHQTLLGIRLFFFTSPKLESPSFFLTDFKVSYFTKLSVLTSGTFALKFPCPIDVDAIIKLLIDLKNLDENLIAIDIETNNKTLTTII